MALGGIFCNMFCNDMSPINNKDLVMKLANDRLKKYLKDFMDDMKEYLDMRPKSPM